MFYMRRKWITSADAECTNPNSGKIRNATILFLFVLDGFCFNRRIAK